MTAYQELATDPLLTWKNLPDIAVEATAKKAHPERDHSKREASTPQVSHV
ncbi:hypothetical protein [Mycolicibacterium sp. CH28]|nr:hypothetical protein [Mycolicibacterium sp. CH28]